MFYSVGVETSCRSVDYLNNQITEPIHIDPCYRYAAVEENAINLLRESYHTIRVTTYSALELV